MTSLRRQEPVGQGLRRIACERVEEAIRCLTRQPGQAPIALQRIDAARAALALLEPHLPRSAVRRDRAIFARLSLGLHQIVQPDALLSRLDQRYRKKSDLPDDNAAADALKQAIKSLRKQWAIPPQTGSALNTRAGSFNPAIYRLVADMAELRGHAGTWPVDELPDNAPPLGLRRTYTQARKHLNRNQSAAASRKTKSAQPADPLAQRLAALTTLDHQLAILTKLAPPMIKAHRKLLARAIEHDTQADLDHQLARALANQQSQRKPAAPPTAQHPSLIQALAETPAGFANRMTRYWSAWRSSD